MEQAFVTSFDAAELQVERELNAARAILDGAPVSKSRTKGAVKKCNVSGEFYPALDKRVREIIVEAERRAIANKRKTLKPADL